jgi:hypothetical protein
VVVQTEVDENPAPVSLALSTVKFFNHDKQTIVA